VVAPHLDAIRTEAKTFIETLKPIQSVGVIAFSDGKSEPPSHNLI